MREEYSLHPVGHIRSTLGALEEAPRRGSEGAPDAWLEVNRAFARALLARRVINVKPVLVEWPDA